MNIIITENQFGLLKIKRTPPVDVDLSSFDENKTLNNKFWDKDGKMYSVVRRRLLRLCGDFLDFINISDNMCKDILLVGSLAGFSWSKYSDVDIHIVVDFKKINKDVNIVQDYFNAKKILWNDMHDELKIYGFTVEFYVQDITDNNSSIGKYSIDKNKWVKIPKITNRDIDHDKIKRKVFDIVNEIDLLDSKFKKSKDDQSLSLILKKAKTVHNKIKKIRKGGLGSADSEFSVGNIVFKTLRRVGYIDLLNELKNKVYDRLNSLK